MNKDYYEIHQAEYEEMVSFLAALEDGIDCDEAMEVLALLEIEFDDQPHGMDFPDDLWD